MERLGDLLFELSNYDRRRILQSLNEEPKRLTQVSNDLGLTIQETSRQLSRLEEIGLEEKDARGFHFLTPYGELVLRQLRGVTFTSQFREYFSNHSLEKLLDKHVDTIGDLVDCICIDNPMEFLRYTDSLFRDSQEYIKFLVDQFPINSLATIVDAIERGVQVQIIEPKERMLNPNLDDLTIEESKTLHQTKQASTVDQRMVDEANVLLFISEKRCILAFPSPDGRYDYLGFTSDNESSINWCNEVFNSYWSQGLPRGILRQRSKTISRKTLKSGDRDTILVEGQDNLDDDAENVQEAVDNYKTVVLRGKFNLGDSSIRISNSVTIRGEGRKDGVPLTSIYKKGWGFPFREYIGVFEIDADDINVTIENLSFTDFNCTSILQRVNPINSVKILQNHITVPTGYGRGLTYGSFGDWIHGVMIQNVGEGGVLIEGNYIDLASWGMWRGALSIGEREESPEYRPDLFNHEYFVGFGIAVNDCSGKVEIKDNIVRNANGRGIALSQHYETAEVYVKNNIVESDVYGSYPFSSRESTAGILAQTGYADKDLTSYFICIEDNTIRLNKINGSGIVALGPVSEGSSKLKSGIIKNNSIYLKDGYEGIHLRKCDDFQVTGNAVSGNAYYGIRVSGHRRFDELDMSSIGNRVKNNNFNGLKIKHADEYTLSHSDGKMFAKTLSELQTAHIWLDPYTKDNEIHLMNNELLLDEGENNKIIETIP